MALTHVCVWDSKIGYRRVTAEEASAMYPHGTVSARSGHFVCELCAQNVCFTAPGMKARHFRHDSAAQNKECEERQQAFDSTYGRTVNSLNSHAMPLRIVVADTTFSLQLGFFYPPEQNAHCDKIKITGDSRQVFEYSFERIEKTGITYLSVGEIPRRAYSIEYINANVELKRYWSNRVPGVNAAGTFFNGDTGQILQPGGKAYSGNSYYLLQKRPLYSPIKDIAFEEVSRIQLTSYDTWHLYKVQAKQFSQYSAKFFLKYSLFLTEKPTKFYPIWPPYIKDTCFIYHNSGEFYFYLCGDDAVLKSYPASVSATETRDGKLYKLRTREKEQLISLGKSGALGFSYLIKQPLNKETVPPTVVISDHAGNVMEDNSYSKLPKFSYISVLSQYDGKAIVRRKGKISRVYMLLAEQSLLIDELTFDTEIILYQGCDCVREIRFEKVKTDYGDLMPDEQLVKKLMACTGPMVPVTHASGALTAKYSAYPQTRQWLRRMIHRGQLPRSAYCLLQKNNN